MNYSQRFRGLYTALITPFDDADKIDAQSFERIIDWQIAEGVHGIVPAGTTGESPTLSFEEHNLLIEIAVNSAGGRVPVMAGTGANATAEAIMLTQHAEKVGVDAVLIAAPYYNKPTPEGIYAHYKAIHDESDIPIFIYNIPGRSVIDISDELLVELAKLPRIAGLKDATGDLSRVPKLLNLLAKDDISEKDFVLFSGEDMTALAFNSSDGKGCISVTANIAPKLCAQLQNISLMLDGGGNHAKALAIHNKLIDLHNAMFCETSPGPVKYAMAQLGYCRPNIRLPLTLPSKQHQQYIDNAIAFLK